MARYVRVYFSTFIDVECEEINNNLALCKGESDVVGI